MKRFLLILFLPLAVDAATVTNFYFSNTNAVGGDGSFGNPYRDLGLMVPGAITNAVYNGFEAHIKLQDGSTFREQWTFSISGVPANRIVVEDYPGANTNLPSISGADKITSFVQYTPGLGSTWSNATAGNSYCWLNDEFLTQGPSESTLMNHQFFITGGVLYVRWDEGNPDSISATVEVGRRVTGLFINGRTNVDFYNIKVGKVTGQAIRIAGTNITFNGVVSEKSGACFWFNNSPQITLRNCHIREAYGNNGSQSDGASTTVYHYYCTFDRMQKVPGMLATGGQRLVYIGCTFSGTKTYHISSSGANTIVACTNCIFSGSGDGDNTGREIIKVTGAGASGIADHCLILPNSKTPTFRLSGCSEVGQVWAPGPGFVSTRHVGYFGFTIDDGQNIDQAVALANSLPGNWKLGHAFSEVAGFQYQQFTNQLRYLATNGHTIMGHSRSHSNMAETRGFKIQYIGGGTVATMTIANSNLTTTIDGVGDLSVPFGALLVSAATNAILTAGAGNYTLDVFDQHEINLPAYCWTNCTAVDIKTTPYTNIYDFAVKMDQETTGIYHDITNILTGTGYQLSAFVNPNGNVSDATITALMAAGFTSDRGVSFPPTPQGYSLSPSNNVWDFAVAQNLPGYSCFLGFENNANDTSGVGGNNFTGNNIVYEQTNVWDNQYSGYFNGTSAYASRAGGGDWNYSLGDWSLTFYIYPLGGGPSVQTLFYNGLNANNNIRVNIESARLKVILKTNGVDVVTLQTPVNTVTNNGWQHIFIQQIPSGLWRVVLNGARTSAVEVVSMARANNFGDTVYVGAGYDFAMATRTNFFKGIMDEFVSGDLGWMNVMGTMNGTSDDGGYFTQYAHSVTTMPPDMWKVDYDTMWEYGVRNGGCAQTVQPEMKNLVATNGFLLSDGRTYYRTNPFPSLQNLNLRPDSGCRMAGNVSAVVGITNLFDLEGYQITDGNGNPVRAQVSLGSREYHPKQHVGL